MKTISLLLLLGIFVATAAHADGMWTDNYKKAVERAKAENKVLFLDFTGSDWCGWCIRLDKEVFSKKEFAEYAKKNLVLVKLDFPRSFNLSNRIVKQNDALAQKYQIRGYPTVILLAPDESVIAQTGYQQGGVQAYIEHLDTLLASYRAGANAPAAKESPAEVAPGGDSSKGEVIERSGGVVRLRKADGSVLTLQTNMP